MRGGVQGSKAGVYSRDLVHASESRHVSGPSVPRIPRMPALQIHMLRLSSRHHQGIPRPFAQFYKSQMNHDTSSAIQMEASTFPY